MEELLTQVNTISENLKNFFLSNYNLNFMAFLSPCINTYYQKSK